MAQSEWLEADGLGGFASGTVSGVRTRRYHALLLAATQPPAGRMVLVNGFDAEIVTSTGRVALSTQRYVPGVNNPDGATRVESFSLEPWPQATYAVGGGRIVQEIFVPRGKAAVVLRWRWEGPADAPLQLDIRPFFSGRDFHGTHHQNPAFRFVPEFLPEGECWHFYDGVPKVMGRSNGTYRHDPLWYQHFLYDEEAARGLDAVEDLAAPGHYEFDLTTEPAVLIFSAEGLGAPLSLKSLAPIDLADYLAQEEQKRRAAFATPRLRAADAYLVDRGSGQTIIAGYPWFGDWGRDTFISMRGICLATGRLRAARDILTAWAGVVSHGMLPNRFPDHGEEPEYNSVDAALWYIVAVHEYLAAAKSDLSLEPAADILLPAVDAILAGYSVGTRFGIRADDDGLLACGVPGVQLTWMDAKVGDHVITPRIGKPVEVQALWLTALGLAGQHDTLWHDAFVHGCSNFHRRFWNEERDCLYDVIDVDHQFGTVDDSIRPNQVLAIGGLPLALLEGDEARRAMTVIEEKLWTPMGLRSLAPDEPEYAGHYTGGPAERDAVYHQGTVWPWLAGPFIDAWVRVRGETPEARAEARERFFLPQLSRLDLLGLHHIPEIADGDAPYTPRGCPFQAWSLGEMLRVENHVL